MKKVIALTTALLLSSTAAIAGTSYKDVSTNQQAQYVTEYASTQAEAEQMGNEFIAELNGSSNFELSQKLPTPHSRMDKRSMELTDTELNIISEEAADGTVSYRAVVDVDYSYDYRAEKS